MGHLVEPLRNVSLADCLEKIREVHEFLRERGKRALALHASDTKKWGSALKRLRADLRGKNRPPVISSDVVDHSITELYNQCATMERLMDAVEWIITKPGLQDLHVRCCHPTTSSDKNQDVDNDLVLTGPSGEPKAVFEVSDVISRTKDGNGKEIKDLVSLGALNEVGAVADLIVDVVWPKGRQLFLIVSEEFADYLRRPTRYWLKQHRNRETGAVIPVHCHYEEVKKDGSSRIFEIKQGARLS